MQMQEPEQPSVPVQPLGNDSADHNQASLNPIFYLHCLFKASQWLGGEGGDSSRGIAVSFIFPVSHKYTHSLY